MKLSSFFFRVIVSIWNFIPYKIYFRDIVNLFPKIKKKLYQDLRFEKIFDTDLLD